MTEDEMTRFTENRRRIDAVSENAAVQEAILAHQERAFAVERKRTNRRLLFTFLAVTAIFLLLAVRTETNAANIRHATEQIRVDTWNVCQTSVKSRASINDTNKAFVDVLSTMPRTPALTKLLVAYQAGILPTLDCGPRP